MSDDATDEFADEIQTSAEIAAMYDDWVDGGAYERDVASWGYDLPARAAALVADHLRAASTSAASVLDAGCGTGLAGAALCAGGVSCIVGADVSVESLRRARQLDVYRGLVHVDLDVVLPFADGSIAAAVSVGVFEYLSDPAATIGELVRVVAPGGVVVVTHRSDMWDSGDLDGALDEVARLGGCTVAVERSGAYLPGHEDFGDDIDGVIVIVTRPCVVPPAALRRGSGSNE